mmetsp:Transcript_12591/g.22240  ORF Transcript_12591/g.22240 Transcript_12591/m.22240 type:complete len:167 (+) Transcript_12591:73-573(+)|eukprot:CAMPEP_0197654068 /NCGR_PEP_ID=MMETSP1338-20131121/38603_1 /TAXON_ID=43686 ORGANISM="Pelagodinium beii, Strain RCC1491" /NCGR_SAMPLE_ID=MMETSP1338 /ASSEMBLY_ACC=CAM_ASM_000754 /LENGTH=166 /DNA_ID=CAMNT_0043229445 /DNA_START=65 /DNA_END=565 /DNA_ORIENTATION=+
MAFEICIKGRQQNITVVRVQEDDTVRMLKKAIQGRLGEKVTEPIYFNGVELGDEDGILLEYGIVQDACPGGPVLHLGTSAAASFDLSCALPDGDILKEHVSFQTSVAQLKGRITSEVGIPYLCMKLFHDGTELRDPMTLADYKLPADCCIEVATTKKLYRGPAAAA